MTINNDKRLLRLQKEKEILAKLLEQWADKDMNKDISENSERDILQARIRSQEQIISKLEKGLNTINIPGTWNIGDKLFVKYLKIVSYDKEKEVPKHRIKIELVDFVDVTTIKQEDLDSKDKAIPVAINTPMGAALLNKAHEVTRFDTPVGYCEIEVERCLF